LNGGAMGGGVNSGSPEVGEGGVAVAEAVVRSAPSGRCRGFREPSALPLAAPPAGAERGGVGAAVSRGGGDEKIPSFQVLRGVWAGRAVGVALPVGVPGVRLLPEEGVL
jgi:hypothetical protein